MYILHFYSLTFNVSVCHSTSEYKQVKQRLKIAKLHLEHLFPHLVTYFRKYNNVTWRGNLIVVNLRGSNFLANLITDPQSQPIVYLIMTWRLDNIINYFHS